MPHDAESRLNEKREGSTLACGDAARLKEMQSKGGVNQV